MRQTSSVTGNPRHFNPVAITYNINAEVLRCDHPDCSYATRPGGSISSLQAHKVNYHGRRVRIRYSSGEIVYITRDTTTNTFHCPTGSCKYRHRRANTFKRHMLEQEKDPERHSMFYEYDENLGVAFHDDPSDESDTSQPSATPAIGSGGSKQGRAPPEPVAATVSAYRAIPLFPSSAGSAGVISAGRRPNMMMSAMKAKPVDRSGPAAPIHLSRGKGTSTSVASSSKTQRIHIELSDTESENAKYEGVPVASSSRAQRQRIELSDTEDEDVEAISVPVTSSRKAPISPIHAERASANRSVIAMLMSQKESKIKLPSLLREQGRPPAPPMAGIDLTRTAIPLFPLSMRVIEDMSPNTIMSAMTAKPGDRNRPAAHIYLSKCKGKSTPVASSSKAQREQIELSDTEDEPIPPTHAGAHVNASVLASSSPKKRATFKLPSPLRTLSPTPPLDMKPLLARNSVSNSKATAMTKAAASRTVLGFSAAGSKSVRCMRCKKDVPAPAPPKTQTWCDACRAHARRRALQRTAAQDVVRQNEADRSVDMDAAFALWMAKWHAQEQAQKKRKATDDGRGVVDGHGNGNGKRARREGGENEYQTEAEFYNALARVSKGVGRFDASYAVVVAPRSSPEPRWHGVVVALQARGLITGKTLGTNYGTYIEGATSCACGAPPCANAASHQLQHMSFNDPRWTCGGLVKIRVEADGTLKHLGIHGERVVVGICH